MNSNIKLGIALSFATAAAAFSTGALAQTSSTASDKSTAAQIGDAISDTAITTKVKTQLSTDNRTKTLKVNVTTNEGVVTLGGRARSEAARSAAEEIAKNTDGVKSVVNNVTLGTKTKSVTTSASEAASSTGEAISDSFITTKVKSSLLTDSKVKDGDVSVTTVGGVVTLSGTVPTSAQKDHAIAEVKKIKGVKSVVSTDLKVAASS